ncbi:hypothetical protein GUJ93_ZPchr0006g44340 [Zizania palustris]|uniref:Uncharacterized protein n=1 Tax=Zizania palustris TaxID=103762 RepID=A0A8J5TBA1_ZIZPA|nr:hypothetical protein GUJ93_ZPchr0006g44340 [Zizania palustris]
MNRCFGRIQISPVNLGVDRTEEVARVLDGSVDCAERMNQQWRRRAVQPCRTCMVLYDADLQDEDGDLFQLQKVLVSVMHPTRFLINLSVNIKRDQVCYCNSEKRGKNLGEWNSPAPVTCPTVKNQSSFRKDGEISVSVSD